MVTGRPRYSAELRKQAIDLVKAGHRPAALARKLGPSEKTIRNWVKQADLDARSRRGELTTEVRRELLRLNQENRRLRLERDILKRAVAWFAAGKGAASTSSPHGGKAAGGRDEQAKGLDS